MNTVLYCPSCQRDNGMGKNGVETFEYKGESWCSSCAKIVETESGLKFVDMNSPGLMIDQKNPDALDIWLDCYSPSAKQRILKKKAKEEIVRAWELWDGDKHDGQAKFVFFSWLTRYRPYFLTFRCQDSLWQTVHCWLIQYENTK